MMEGLNRAFLYGESVFTTLKLQDGSLVDWEPHFHRLMKGVDFVFGPFLDGAEGVGRMKEQLEARVKAEVGNKVIRMAIYREGGRGLAACPPSNLTDLKAHVSVTAFEDPLPQGPQLKLRTCMTALKPDWWPSYLKAGSYLETILARKLFLTSDDEELLFTSPSGQVLSASTFNIFVVIKDRLYTPALGPNVLDGIMRRKVLKEAHAFFEQTLEGPVEYGQLSQAEAVFGTNSLRGPFLISSVDGHDYTAGQSFLERFARLRERVWK